MRLRAMIISAKAVGFSGGAKNPHPCHEQWLADKDCAELGTAQSQLVIPY